MMCLRNTKNGKNGKKYRWGIVGTGRMAHTFARALALTENAEITAVCSRTLKKAQKFAKEVKAAAAYDSVMELASDENVDIVYICTPHTDHADSSLAAIACGKAVLCEKPMALNAWQAKAVIDAAKENNVFFMEGMWTRFNPAVVTAKEWIDEGLIGDVKEVNASFFGKTKYDTSNRVISFELGGGALLDIGVYNIFLAQWLLGGRPGDIRSLVNHCENGIDWQSAAVMKFYNGGTASVSCGFEYSAIHAEITGTKGVIMIPDFVWANSAYAVREKKIIREYSDSDSNEKKYGCEIRHVMQCLDEGLTESPMYPTWMSFDILDTCDRLRADWHQVYPGDNHIPAFPEKPVRPAVSANDKTEEAPAQVVTEKQPELPKVPKAAALSKAPDWYRDAAFYHIYPLGFCGENRFNDFTAQPTGKIRKVIPFVKHLRRIGANAVYFGPVFESTKHGYDTADYRVIDRRLGTNRDFADVCSELHKNGIKVVLDGVFNHVGRDFWAFRDVKQHKWNSAYKDWFNIKFDGNSNYNDGFWYEGWEGYYDLVKLNLRNSDVKQHIFSCIEGWVNEFGIDGLRLDVAYCLDRDFLRELHNFCKSRWNDFFLLGECLHGDYNTWCNDAMLDSVTNYECYKGLYSSFNCANMHEIGYSLNRQFADEQWTIYKGKNLYCFADNHDVTRIASILTDKSNLPLVYSLLFAMPGIPSVYYGSEFGTEAQKSQGDDALRPEFSEEQAESGWNTLSAHISRLYSVRESSPALCRGGYKQLHINSKQLVFLRQFEGERVIFALNMDDAPYTAHFDAGAGSGTDLLTGQSVSFGGGLNLPAQTAYIIRL